MGLKIIWRASLIIGISIILSSVISCTKRIDNIKTINYIYKNQTGIDLVMEIYNSDKEMFKSFEISNNNEVETNTTKVEGGPALFYFDSFNSKIGDSIVIKFNNNQCIHYSKNIPDKIFKVNKYDNYTEDLNSQSSYTLYYTLTIDDYNSSIVCE